MNKNKYKFSAWNRDKQADFVDALAEEFDKKADKSDISECDTSDKVSKSGDTMTGNLTIGNSANPTDLRFVRYVGTTPIGGFISDNGQGLTFGSTNSGSRNSLYAMSNGSTLGFYPLINNLFPLGNSIYKWSAVFAAKLNNGADIAIPNKAGTLALLSDIPDSQDVSDKVSKSGDTMTGRLRLKGEARTNAPLSLVSDNNSEILIFPQANATNMLFEKTSSGTFTLGWSGGFAAAFAALNFGSIATSLGTSTYKWGTTFTTKLNNGADIAIPNKAGTLALLSDIEDVLKQHGLIS